MVITLLPPSKRPMRDAAEAAIQAGQHLYTNGRALVSAPRKPGADWHRIGVKIKEAA